LILVTKIKRILGAETNDLAMGNWNDASEIMSINGIPAAEWRKQNGIHPDPDAYDENGDLRPGFVEPPPIPARAASNEGASS
jgi:hypothetical protein